jgi:xanthine dehydrogenase YagR molybdenum-binding subunit
MVEPLGSATSITYSTPNFGSRQIVVPINTVLPGPLRTPDENLSAFCIECAIDELAYATSLDPFANRLLNYADEDPHAKMPWSTRRLREAFTQGAEAFGWSKRNPAPRSMREGSDLIGYGLAAGTYRVRRTAGDALVQLLADGSVEVASAVSIWDRVPIRFWPKPPRRSACP